MKTHLYDYHKEHGHLIDFAGFKMPVWYKGIVPEHLVVRNSVGIFDVTHMGRCVVEGPEASTLLNHVLTRDVVSLAIGQGRYSVMCNEQGGIVDDLIVFRLEEERFLIVYNASNRKKDFTWISNQAKRFQVETKDVSNEVVMFAVQGPRAFDTLQSIANADLSIIKFYWGTSTTLDDYNVFMTRTGYTGEDGFEIYLWNTPLAKAKKAKDLWQTILKAGDSYGIKPCGLGARNTLRLEAGMNLYGNDIDESTTPLEAGLDFVVQLEKPDFVGKKALQRQKNDGVKRVRVGIRVLDRGIPRAGNSIYLKGKEIGRLTSGTFSPLLKYGIAMGYVPPEYSRVGTRIEIKQKSILQAEIVSVPFYDETRYGRKRKVV